jgi:hypothetical protein
MAGIVTNDSLRPGGPPVDAEIVRHSQASIPPFRIVWLPSQVEGFPMTFRVWFVFFLSGDTWNILSFHLISISWFIMLSAFDRELVAVARLDGHAGRMCRRRKRLNTPETHLLVWMTVFIIFRLRSKNGLVDCSILVFWLGLQYVSLMGNECPSGAIRQETTILQFMRIRPIYGQPTRRESNG